MRRRGHRSRPPTTAASGPGSEPPPTVDSDLPRRAVPVASAMRPRARRSSPRRPALQTWRQTGISACATPARYSRSVAASAARITLSGRIARASGSRRSRSTRSARPGDDPRLRPADELVAGERHEVRAGREALGRHRLVGQPEARGVEQRAGAEVVDDDRAVAVRDGRQLRRVGRLHEPGLGEVRRVDAQHELRAAVGEDRLEVGHAGAIRRSHLDEPRARAPDRPPGSGRRRRSRRARRATPPRRPGRRARPRARRPPRCCS